MAQLLPLFFIHSFGQEQVFGFLSRCGVDDVGGALARHIMQDVHVGELNQCFIDVLLHDAKTKFQNRLVDEHIIGKQPRISAQQRLQHSVDVGVFTFYVIQVLLLGND